MTVAEIIAALQVFPMDAEVLITDGYGAKCYRGGYEIIPYLDNDVLFVDIGIGGCNE